MANRNITITLTEEVWDILRQGFPQAPVLNEKMLSAMFMFLEAYHHAIRPKGLPPVIDIDEDDPDT